MLFQTLHLHIFSKNWIFSVCKFSAIQATPPPLILPFSPIKTILFANSIHFAFSLPSLFVWMENVHLSSIRSSFNLKTVPFIVPYSFTIAYTCRCMHL